MLDPEKGRRNSCIGIDFRNGLNISIEALKL